jgi:hypothetical protein
MGRALTDARKKRRHRLRAIYCTRAAAAVIAAGTVNVYQDAEYADGAWPPPPNKADCTVVH